MEDNKSASSIYLMLRYHIALILILLISGLDILVTQSGLMQQLNDAKLINIAGRQRMLTQGIMKNALAIETAASASLRQYYFNEFQKALILWERSHLGLKNGNKDMGLQNKNSKKITELFSAIEPAHQNFLTTAKRIMALPPNSAFPKTANAQMLIEEKILTSGLEAIVRQYEKEAKNRVIFHHIIIDILFGITVAVFIIPSSKILKGLRSADKSSPF